MVAGAGIPLLVVSVAGAMLVGLAPMENYSQSDPLMQLSPLLAVSLLSPILPLAAFIIATVQFGRSLAAVTLPWEGPYDPRLLSACCRHLRSIV